MKLFELNMRSDIFNGHVPISAIYAFVGLLTSALYEYSYIITSNEESANYGNVFTEERKLIINGASHTNSNNYSRNI